MVVSYNVNMSDNMCNMCGTTYHVVIPVINEILKIRTWNLEDLYKLSLARYLMRYIVHGITLCHNGNVR